MEWERTEAGQEPAFCASLSGYGMPHFSPKTREMRHPQLFLELEKRPTSGHFFCKEIKGNVNPNGVGQECPTHTDQKKTQVTGSQCLRLAHV